MNEKKITKIEVNGNVYTLCQQDVNDFVIRAENAAEIASIAAVSARNTSIATLYLIGGLYIEEFDQTKSYSKGDPVLVSTLDENSKPLPSPYLYIAKEDLIAGEWDESNWTQTSLVKLIFGGLEQLMEVIRVLLKYLDGSFISDKNVQITTYGESYNSKTDEFGYAYFSIPYDIEYIIVPPAIEGYVTPKNKTSTSNSINKYFTFVYTDIESGLFVIKSSGEVVKYENWNTDDNDEAVLLKYQTSLGACTFKIANTVAVKVWCQKSDTLIPDMPVYSSSSLAVVDWNGVQNTNCMHDYAVEFPSPAVEYCLDLKVTIGGLEYSGYLPSLGLMNTLMLNNNEINEALTNLGGTTRSFSSGRWWSSSLSSAASAWNLYNGSLDNYAKSLSYLVLPFFDF